MYRIIETDRRRGSITCTLSLRRHMAKKKENHLAEISRTTFIQPDVNSRLQLYMHRYGESLVE